MYSFLKALLVLMKFHKTIVNIWFNLYVLETN